MIQASKTWRRDDLIKPSGFKKTIPYINGTEFGHITINGQKYGQVLIVGEQITERDYAKLTQLFGTSHQIGDWEVAKLLEQNPEMIVIGTGQSGMLNVDQNFYDKIKESGVDVITDITPKAIKIYNEKVKEGKRVNALIHTTC